MKKNIIRILIGIVIIALTLTIFLIAKLHVNNNEVIDVPYIIENNIEPISEEVIIPNNSYMFFGKYISGDVESKEIYEIIYNFSINTIKKYNNEFVNRDDSYIIKYYEQNKQSIYNDLLEFNSSEEFVKFANKIKNLNKDFTVQSIEFDANSIISYEKYTTARLFFNYNDNQSIDIYIKVFLEKTEGKKHIVFYESID